MATKQDHVKKVVVKKKVASVTSQSLTELHELRLRLEGAEAGLTQHIHICLAEDGAHDCGLRITQLEVHTHTNTQRVYLGVYFTRSTTGYVGLCLCM